MSGNGINMVFNAIKNKNSKLQAIQKAVKEIGSQEALVGIPQEKNSKADGQKITQAELLYIHTNGSPANNIPARDVIDPALKHSKDQIKLLMKNVLLKAFDGDIDGAKSALEKAGVQGANISKEWFTNPANNWEPNSKTTIEGTKNGWIKAKGSDRPLIDTGELRKSITSVVRKKGETKK